MSNIYNINLKNNILKRNIFTATCIIKKYRVYTDQELIDKYVDLKKKPSARIYTDENDPKLLALIDDKLNKDLEKRKRKVVRDNYKIMKDLHMENDIRAELKKERINDYMINIFLFYFRMPSHVKRALFKAKKLHKNAKKKLYMLSDIETILRIKYKMSIRDKYEQEVIDHFNNEIKDKFINR